MLNWTKQANGVGHEATGASGRYYSILKHGVGRFRLAGGGGKYDQKIGTLSALKALCEEVEAACTEFAGVLGTGPDIGTAAIEKTEAFVEATALVQAATDPDGDDDGPGGLPFDPTTPFDAPPPFADPDLDLGHIVLPPQPPAELVQEPAAPEPHPDTEMPLAPEPDTGDPGAYHRSDDRDSLPSTLDRLYRLRDLCWRSGGYLVPVKRYGSVRRAG